jgi:RHS repeat-associated protein
MKNIIFYVFILTTSLVFAQNSDMNWIKGKTYRLPSLSLIPNPTVDQVSTNIVYYDGLGRPIQKIAYAQGANGNDIVTHIDYDGYGRQTKDFLPYVTTTNSLDFNTNAETAQSNYYDQEIYGYTENPYSESLLENSPLSRVLKQAAPGNSWKLPVATTDDDHTIRFNYTANSSDDLVVNFHSIRVYNESTKTYNNTLNSDGYYPIGTLIKSVVKDENWTAGNNNTTEEFKDYLGRVVLKRSYNDSEKLDTYYVYDEIGNLTYVIPPLASDNIVQIQTSQVPLNFSQSYSLDAFLNMTNGSTIQGGGGMTLNIQNSTISLTFSLGWAGTVVFDTSTFLPINLNHPYPLPDMLLGYIDFYYTGNHQYTVSIVNNQIKFDDYTPATPLFEFTDLGSPNNFGTPQNISKPLDPNFFTNTTTTTAVINSNELNGLCYQYKYDHRNRLVAKKIPGKQWEYMVYDKLDRIRATGPVQSPFSNLVGSGWMFTKYDSFNRPILTSWVSATIDENARISLQNSIEANTNMYENRTANAATYTTVNGIKFNYSNLSYPTTGYHTLSVNYYDNYTYLNGPTSFPQVLTQNVRNATSNSCKGLTTGNWVRILETSTLYKGNSTHTIYKSDYLAIPVLSKTLYSTTGYTENQSLFDFEGKMTKSVTKHKRFLFSTELTTTENFYYSTEGRLTNHTHQINNGIVENIVTNEYLPLGQISTKKVGNTSSNPLQKVDFSYNIRGWLTDINNVNDNGDDLFAFAIKYDDPENNNTPLFNGNISEAFWYSKSDSKVRTYQYKYDNLNRLTQALYKNETNFLIQNTYDEILNYDKNGNILTLQRNGGLESTNPAIQIDNLTYFYDPIEKNKLLKVVDGSLSTSGFKDGTNTGDDYTYDANGNMTVDKNKNITSITYNHLNLPTKVIFGTTGNIVYTYDAVGTKIKKVVTQGATVTTTEYLNGYQYSNNVLQFFPHAEGYVKHTAVSGGSVYNYVYNYTDHLGNVRMSYTKDPATGLPRILEENHNYPFGLSHQYNTTDYEITANLSGSISITQVIENKYQYQYNGKEWQDELGLNMTAMDFRQYDNAIGRFVGMDRLSELIQFQSPYGFSYNNPNYWSDPSGLFGEAFTDYYDDGKGNIIYDPNVHGPDDVPSGATYIGPTYTDPNTGTYWDENGMPTYQLNEVVITSKRSDDPLFWINSVLGSSSLYYAKKAGYLTKNEFWHVDSRGIVHTIIDNKWSKSKNVRIFQTRKFQLPRNISNGLAAASIITTAYNVVDKGELKASDVLYATMAGISFTGVGSVVAGVFFMADLATMGFTYVRDGKSKSIGDILDENTRGGVLLNGDDFD